VRVLSAGPPPVSYVPRRSGFGAGTRDPRGRPNVLRIVLADAVYDAVHIETLVQLSTDVDDMDGEQLAGVADLLRAEGALDVVLVPTLMKKGRSRSRSCCSRTAARSACGGSGWSALPYRVWSARLLCSITTFV